MSSLDLSNTCGLIFKDFNVCSVLKGVVRRSNDCVHVQFRRVVWQRPVISVILAVTRAEHLGTYHSPTVQAKPLKGCLGVNPICIEVQPSGLRA